MWAENLHQVMGKSILVWGLPFYNPEMKGWGFYFPQIPDVNQQQIGILQKDAVLEKKDEVYEYKDQCTV